MIVVMVMVVMVGQSGEPCLLASLIAAAANECIRNEYDEYGCMNV